MKSSIVCSLIISFTLSASAQMRWELVDFSQSLIGGPDTCAYSLGAPSLWGSKMFRTGICTTDLTVTNKTVTQYLNFGSSSTRGRQWSFVPTKSRVFSKDYYLVAGYITPIDSNNAVCGGLPYIWHSGDAGSTWDTVSLSEKYTGNHMFASFNNKGEVVFSTFYSGTIPLSMDRGASWKVITPPEADKDTYISAAITETGCVFTSQRGITHNKYHTVNFISDSTREHWTRIGYSVDGVVRSSNDSAMLLSIKFATDTVGYSLLDDWSGPKGFSRRLIKTVNQGRTWSTIFVVPQIDANLEIPAGFLVIGRDSLVIYSNYGRVFLSVDAGVTWQKLVSKRAKTESNDLISDVGIALFRNLQEAYLYAGTNVGMRFYQLVPDSTSEVIENDSIVASTSSSFITAIAPNPAEHYINVSGFSLFGTGDANSSLKVYDISGECVLDFTKEFRRVNRHGTFSCVFSIEGLNDGLFLLVISDKKSISSKSLVIHR